MLLLGPLPTWVCHGGDVNELTTVNCSVHPLPSSGYCLSPAEEPPVLTASAQLLTMYKLLMIKCRENAPQVQSTPRSLEKTQDFLKLLKGRAQAGGHGRG